MTSRRSTRLLAAFVLCLASAARATDEGFMLRDGDRVVFLGDSITEQRLYTTYIEAYAQTRFPDWKLRFWNAGWGGDTAWLRMRSFPDEAKLFAAEGDEQQKLIEASVDGPLKRDVLELEPTVVFVNFGMNDHNYEAFREDIFKAHVRGQARICRLLTAAGARPILLTPQAIEPRSGQPAGDRRNAAIRRFAEGVRGVAAEHGGTFINQYDPYVAIMTREHMRDVNASIGGGDEVHPAPAGHLLMAAIILERLRAPALVSRAAIDVADGQGKVAETARCAVTNLKMEKGVLGFDRADECLPMPVDERAQAALKLAPILDRLDRYELQVVGLPADRYEVVIDGEVVTTVTREELAAGWNLATTAGPIGRQAAEVLALIFKKNQAGQTLWEARIRPQRKAELPGLQEKLEKLEAQLAAACKTKPHHYELKPAGP